MIVNHGSGANWAPIHGPYAARPNSEPVQGTPRDRRFRILPFPPEAILDLASESGGQDWRPEARSDRPGETDATDATDAEYLNSLLVITCGSDLATPKSSRIDAVHIKSSRIGTGCFCT